MKKPHELTGRQVIRTFLKPVIVDGRFKDEKFYWNDVRCMVVAEGYAMCRRPRAMPFVCDVRELSLRP